MRFLGVDPGRRRIGLALSDDSGVLARPWKTLAAEGDPERTARAVAAAIAEARAREDLDIAAVVVGLPRRLNGEDNDQTAGARQLAEAIGRASGLPVDLQDERLTSVEAEARLAARESDWRRRKARIDAEAAAIILQDFLDARGRTGEAAPC
jgi:putative Holliday junction resolvase